MSKIGDFLWGIAIKKGITQGMKALLAAFGVKLAAEAAQVGVTVTFNEAALIASVVAGLETARNYAKQKWGLKFL